MRHRSYQFLIYTLTVFTLFLSFAPAAIAQRRGDFDREVHETYPFEVDGRISLENINGDVNITAWDRDEVKIDAYISAYSQEQLDEVDIDIDARRNRLYIETRYPNRWSDGRNNRNRSERPARVDYTLSVPRSVTLDEIKLINGNLDLKDVAGEIHTTSINGRIRGENLGGEVRISTVNGDMDLSILQIDRANPIEVTSVNGRVRLTIPSDTNARVSANTVHGRISNDFDLPVNKGRFVGRKLSGRIGDGDGRIELSNVNGTITLRRADDGRAESPVENLLRETKSRSRWDNDDDDWDWDNDSDEDDDEDDDGWSGRSSRWNRDNNDNLSETLQDVQSLVMEIVGTTLDAIDIDDIEIDHRREVVRERHEIRRDVQEGMREAQREIQRAMREVEREIQEWDQERDW